MHDTTELPELAEGAPDRLADRSRNPVVVRTGNPGETVPEPP
jgi:hypothetical protein